MDYSQMTEIVVVILLLAYREVQILIDRGSWDADMFWIKFWYVDWRSKWKDFDSYHVIQGAIAYLVIRLLDLPDFIGLKEISDAGYWLGYYYIRNLFLHIIFRKQNREWKYLIPFNGLIKWSRQ